MTKTKIQSWNCVSANVALVFVLVALHFVDNVWIVLALALAVDFIIAALRFPLFSLFIRIGKLLDHHVVLNIVALGTAIYFFVTRQWLAGMIAALYCYILGPVFQMPGVFIWDKLLGQPDARIYAYFKLKSKRTGQQMPPRTEMQHLFQDEPFTEEKADILAWMGIDPCTIEQRGELDKK
ncbi:MAG: hypothetical protein J7L73_08515 [Anaerolineales bacterium]|nr:hypothetical protein [Anaerolineales bacterium]